LEGAEDPRNTKQEGVRMTKDELVARVANAAGMPKTHVNKVIKATLDEITKCLKKGDKVSFVGFGTFKTAKRAARTGRNPQTGAKIKIPATVVPKFSAGKSLKQAVSKKRK